MKRLFIQLIVLFLTITVIPISFFAYSVVSSAGQATLIIYDSLTQRTARITEKEYLIGALFAQTNVDFDIEMLKAQAVIIYTNAIFEKNKNTDKHFDFESNSSLYWDKEKAKNVYGDSYENNLSKITTAVNEVYGEMVTYNSQLVFLPYFYCSNGKTEDAAFIWGEEIGYLKAVSSEGDLINPHIKSRCFLTLNELKKAVYNTYKLEFSDSQIPTVIINGRTESGTVTSCTIEELTMTGQNFRSLFNLCSANFDVKIDETHIEITCYGNGHYVGMSQYGADFMARQGYDYKQILKHYYTNIEIT